MLSIPSIPDIYSPKNFASGNYVCNVTHKQICFQTGKCICKSGYHGDECASKCPDGLWGEGCNRPCACDEEAVCDWATGTCLTDCKAGWMGEDCDQRKCRAGRRDR